MKLPRTKFLQGKNQIGPAMRRLRKGLKPVVTLEDLSGRLAARGLTLDRSALSRIENQARTVFDFEVARIAEALRVPIAALYEGE